MFLGSPHVFDAFSSVPSLQQADTAMCVRRGDRGDMTGVTGVTIVWCTRLPMFVRPADTAMFLYYALPDDTANRSMCWYVAFTIDTAG